MLPMHKARRFVLKNGDIRLYLRRRRPYHEAIVLNFRKTEDGARILYTLQPHRLPTCYDRDEHEQPICIKDQRYIALRSDTIVYASGYLVIDTATGIWKRLSGAPARAFELVKWLHRHERLRKKFDADVWPDQLRREIKETRARIWTLGWRAAL